MHEIRLDDMKKKITHTHNAKLRDVRKKIMCDSKRDNGWKKFRNKKKRRSFEREGRKECENEGKKKRRRASKRNE